MLGCVCVGVRRVCVCRVWVYVGCVFVGCVCRVWVYVGCVLVGCGCVQGVGVFVWCWCTQGVWGMFVGCRCGGVCGYMLLLWVCL